MPLNCLQTDNPHTGASLCKNCKVCKRCPAPVGKRCKHDVAKVTYSARAPANESQNANYEKVSYSFKHIKSVRGGRKYTEERMKEMDFTDAPLNLGEGDETYNDDLKTKQIHIRAPEFGFKGASRATRTRMKTILKKATTDMKDVVCNPKDTSAGRLFDVNMASLFPFRESVLFENKALDAILSLLQNGNYIARLCAFAQLKYCR